MPRFARKDVLVEAFTTYEHGFTPMNLTTDMRARTPRGIASDHHDPPLQFVRFPERIERFEGFHKRLLGDIFGVRVVLGTGVGYGIYLGQVPFDE